MSLILRKDVSEVDGPSSLVYKYFQQWLESLSAYFETKAGSIKTIQSKPNQSFMLKGRKSRFDILFTYKLFISFTEKQPKTSVKAKMKFMLNYRDLLEIFLFTIIGIAIVASLSHFALRKSPIVGGLIGGIAGFSIISIWGEILYTEFARDTFEYIIKTPIHKIKREFQESQQIPEMPSITERIQPKHSEQISIFLSYSTLDSEYFQMEKIVNELEKYKEIEKVFFWESDSGENIVKFMDETLKRTNVFILFCTDNSMNSKAVNDEWQAAFQRRKKGLMKIIPVFEDENHTPPLLGHLINVKYIKHDFEGFIKKLLKEILRE